MKERYFDNQRFKKIRWIEIGVCFGLLLSGAMLFILESNQSEITENMIFALVLSMLGLGYTLPIFTEIFYIRKTGSVGLSRPENFQEFP